jgi:hypothetical protein
MSTWHSILEFFGVVGESGKGYAFFSGIGSDIGELAIVGGLLALIRHHNCHVDRCWRIGRHPVAGTSYIVCRKHHPEGGVTHEHILQLHHEHLAAVAKTKTAVLSQEPA